MTENICYLSVSTNQDVNNDGTNDVDALVRLANLADAITNWVDSSRLSRADALRCF